MEPDHEEVPRDYVAFAAAHCRCGRGARGLDDHGQELLAERGQELSDTVESERSLRFGRVYAELVDADEARDWQCLALSRRAEGPLGG